VTHSSQIPENWRFHLLLPSGRYLHGAEEFEFFRRNTPIPSHEAWRAIALAYHGLAPAVSSGDLPLLREVLMCLHRVGFKRRELRGQSASVRWVVRELRKRTDVAVGLSSMGPLVYAVADADNRNCSRYIESLCRQGAAELLGVFAGRNLGYESY
jgi:beta-ribofuranosylaminobenzene 5'-phosphate synthase